jgi:hypothetical protein
MHLLDEHIGVYNGHLLSDLAGAPVVPDVPSKYEWSSDLWYHIGGKGTCIDETGQSPDWCETLMSKCTSASKGDTVDAPIQQIAPLPNCWQPNFYSPHPIAFSGIKLVALSAWELTLYADGACTKKLGVISPEQAGQCLTFNGEKVRGVTSRPLFNGDPQ